MSELRVVYPAGAVAASAKPAIADTARTLSAVPVKFE